MADLPTAVSLEVATPVGMALSISTTSVQLPGAGGELGILPGHLPILAAVKPGVLVYLKDGQKERAAIGGGYVEADAKHVRLLTEFFVTPAEVNLEQAQKDLAEAEARMKALKGTIDDVEHGEVRRDMDWAQARIELAKGSSN